MIWAASLTRAAGQGWRTITKAAGRPASMVRGWLDRYAAQAESIRVTLAWVERRAAGGGDLDRLTPTGSVVGDAVAQIGAAVAAVRRRCGGAALTGATPAERYHAQRSAPARRPDPAVLRRAFLWREQHKVTSFATVYLHGNGYQVEPALVGRTVDLLFTPFDLTVIDVEYQGWPMGRAVPHKVTRHVHPRETRLGRPGPGHRIGYLRLLQTAHQQEAGGRSTSPPFRPPPTDHPEVGGFVGGGTGGLMSSVLCSPIVDSMSAPGQVARCEPSTWSGAIEVETARLAGSIGSTDRLHSSIDYLPPITDEQQYRQTSSPAQDAPAEPGRFTPSDRRAWTAGSMPDSLETVSLVNSTGRKQFGPIQPCGGTGITCLAGALVLSSLLRRPNSWR